MPLSSPASTLRFRERSPRFPTDIHMEVKTFGSQFANELEAINISKSGVLACAFAHILPFQISTILEITIDPRKVKLPQPVECIGKVKRVEHIAFRPGDDNEEHEIVLFGIQFTEMENDHAKIWEAFVDAIEKVSPPDKSVDHYTLIKKSLLTKQKNAKAAKR